MGVKRSKKVSMRKKSRTQKEGGDARFFENLVENSNRGVFVLFGRKIVYANKRGATLFGFKNAEELILSARTIVTLTAPHERKRLRAYQRAREQKHYSPATYEYQGIHKDGSFLWLQAQARRIAWREAPGVLLTVADISRRKKAEDELRLHSEILGNLTEGVSLVRVKDSIIVYTNRQYEKMFGYRKDELIGKHIRVLNAPAERDPDQVAREITSVLKKDRVWTGEVLNVKKNKRVFWSALSISTFHHPWHGDVWISVREDITERKKTEGALKESERRFRNLAVGSIQGIAVHRDFKPLFVNEAYAQIHRYKNVGDVLALKSLLSLVAPHERKRLVRYKTSREQGRSAPSHYEYEARRKDGSLVWLDIKVTAIEWGGKMAILSFAFDITERKRIEQRMQDYSKTLEREVAEQTKTLRATHRAKERFVSDASHQLRTPLAIMRSNIDLALRKLTADTPRYYEEMIVALDIEVREVSQIIESLTTLIQTENTSETHSRNEHIEINHVLKNTAAKFTILARERAVGIHVHHSPPSYVKGNRVEIDHILTNLLSNAIRYNTAGGTVALSISQSAKNIRVIVTDSGIGITQKDLPHIFERFYRSDTLRAKQEDGVGLGLSICKTLMEAHKGTITASSTLGKGSAFVLAFPKEE